MLLRRRTPWLAAWLGFSISGLLAQTPADPSGHWEGAIHAPFGDVNIEIDLARSAPGGFAGTFSNPSDHLKGFPLAAVAVKGTSVHLLLKASSGGGAFDGNLSTNAQSLSGIFVTAEGGFSVPFDLSRAGDARIDPAPASPAVGKELEGSWNGTLAVDGTQRRMLLTISNRPGGTSTATLLSIEEGLEFPIAIAQNASTLTFAVKSVGASYAGVLNVGATELAGIYTEGGLTAPLTFRRAQ